MSEILDANGERRPLRVCVAIPSHDMVPVTFAYDLGQLMSFTMAAMPEGTHLGITMVPGTYIHQARQQLLAAVREQGVDYVLWLDSDMRFPKEALVKLFQRQKDFVGINYSTRGLPPQFVAIKRGGWKSYEDRGEKLVTDEDSTGLEEVDALGFGCVLMRMAAFEDLPDGEPWFWYELVHDNRHIGEDVYFCRLAKEELGLDIYVDHDLSKLCAHTGSFEFELGHVAAFAEDE